LNADLDAVRGIFGGAPFVADLGIEPTRLVAGECDSALVLQPRHLQHSGQVHAGVMATMADHTAGAAAQSMVRGGGLIVTAELKLNLLRAAKGERLECRARVVKPGRNLMFTEAEVLCFDGTGSTKVATLSATMAVVEPR